MGDCTLEATGEACVVIVEFRRFGLREVILADMLYSLYDILEWFIVVALAGDDQLEAAGESAVCDIMGLGVPYHSTDAQLGYCS